MYFLLRKFNINKKIFIGSILIFLISINIQNSYSQGCSDAGFCTMGAMRPNQHYSKGILKKLKTVELTTYTGITKFNDRVNSLTFDMNFALNQKMTLQAKCPYFYVNGPLGQTQGIGDISLAFTHYLTAIKNLQFNGTIGTKIPTNQSNKTNSELNPLPMYYQSSLGTYDVIVGLSAISSKWLLALGYQQALNANGNEFLWGAWKNSTLSSLAQTYPRAKDLKRGKDVMFRIERNVRFSRFNSYLGLLFIQRITADKFTHPTFGENTQDNDSKGLALTALAGVGYAFSVKNTIKGMFGYALVQRKVNLDGLTRDNVATISYEYKF